MQTLAAPEVPIWSQSVTSRPLFGTANMHRRPVYVVGARSTPIAASTGEIAVFACVCDSTERLVAGRLGSFAE
jgi:hypothetical protein